MFNRIFKNDKIYSIWDEDDLEKYEENRQMLQQDILDISLNNNLFLSNIIADNDKYHLVLNLGSGYCMWSKKILEKFKNFYIINIDIINYYKNNDEILMDFQNVNLKKDKIKFKDNTVSYIYNRDMITVYDFYEWDNILNEIYRVLINNGSFEIVEYDVSIKHNTIFKTNVTDIFDKYLKDYLKQNNLDNIHSLYNKINKLFKNSDIKHVKIKLPLYYESKYKGMCFFNYILGLKHFKKELDSILKTKINVDFDEAINILQEELDQNKSYMELNIIYGKKII